MPTKPKHYAMFILNENGSGVVKQFDTWQEAKAAYAAESATGKAVYLYPQPMKSIGAGTTPIEAPAKTPVAFTPQQNTGQFAWPDHPPLPRPTAPRDGESSGGLFGDEPGPFYKWMNYCKLHPTHRECTLPGKEKFGTLASVACVPAEGNFGVDDKGNEFPAYIPQQIFHNGLGGTFEGSSPEGAQWFDAPCQLPNGYMQYSDSIFDAPEIVVFTLKSTATAGPAFLGRALVAAERDLFRFNGSGGSVKVLTERGLRDPNNYKTPFVPAEDGDPITNVATGQVIGTINVVYPLMPLAESMTEEVGTVSEDTYVTIVEHGTQQVKTGHRFATKYENKWPAMNPDSVVSNIGYDPEFGTGTGAWSITHSVSNGVNFEWMPGTPADGRPPEGWAGFVERSAGGDFNRVDPPIPAPEGQTWLGSWEYDYYPNGTILDEDTEAYYKSDGAGSYFVESKNAPECEPADTLVNEDATEPIILQTACGDWSFGTTTYDVFADGNCSYYEVTKNNSYDAAGTFLGKCGDYCYTTNGGPEPDMTTCVPENEQVGDATTSPLTYDAGCGVWEIGTRSVATISNGDCTTREETTDTYNAGDIGTCNGYIYSVDSVGAVTSREDNPPPPPCADAGTEVSRSGNNDLMYDAGCGSILIGYYQEVTMNDGSCGTYVYNENHSTPGDFTTCNGNIYTVDSTGNVTSRPECEDPNAHSGESGWSYDGCHWSYSEPCPMQDTDLGVAPYDSCYNLYADGNCGTYSSSNGSCGGGGCDSSGMEIGSEGPYDLMYDAGCGSIQIGYYYNKTYADGSCGSYTQQQSTSSPGDFTTCNGYIYSVDASGNVSSRQDNACPSSGSFDHSDECNNYYTDGSCGYYSEPNGMCGGGCPSNGEYAYSDGCIDYYHNGECGYYSVDNCGNGCTGSGNWVGSSMDSLYYNAGCGDWYIGSVNWQEYTDGNCGTYRSYDSPNYNGSGNYLGDCNGWAYYTDGNGGAYTW